MGRKSFLVAPLRRESCGPGRRSPGPPETEISASWTHRLPSLGPRRRTFRQSSAPVAPGSTGSGVPTGVRPAPESLVERAVVGPPSNQVQGCIRARRHPQRAEQGIAADQAGEAPSWQQNSGVRRRAEEKESALRWAVEDPSVSPASARGRPSTAELTTGTFATPTVQKPNLAWCGIA